MNKKKETNPQTLPLDQKITDYCAEFSLKLREDIENKLKALILADQTIPEVAIKFSIALFLITDISERLLRGETSLQSLLKYFVLEHRTTHPSLIAIRSAFFLGEGQLFLDDFDHSITYGIVNERGYIAPEFKSFIRSK